MALARTSTRSSSICRSPGHILAERDGRNYSDYSNYNNYYYYNYSNYSAVQLLAS